MKLLFQKLTILLIFCSIFSCVEQIEPFDKNSEEVLIINGIISTENKSQKVQIQYSSGFTLKKNYVEDAQVWIVDNTGIVEELHYVGKGEYLSSQFYGEIGKSYHIEILMSDGQFYSSSPDPLSKVPEIDTIYYIKNGESLDFFVQFVDAQEVKNYYQWRYVSTFQVEAPFAPVGDPNKICWANEFDEQFLKILDDRYFDGEKVKSKVCNIELNPNFNFGYYLKIQQISLSEGAYTYWKSLQSQLENTGSILETANFQITGNIFNVNDPNEVVLGYFSAQDVAENHIFVDEFVDSWDPLLCPEEAEVIPQRCSDCLFFSGSASVTKPSFWPN